MTHRLLVALIPAFLTACTPAATEGLAAARVPIAVSLACSGEAAGTHSRSDALLNLKVTSEGEAQGSFLHQRMLSTVTGSATVQPNRTTGTLDISQVTLTLEPNDLGPANTTTPLGFYETNAALARSLGLKDTLSASISQAGALTGILRSVKGTLSVTMTCTTS
jgi:hypothetical protein